MNTDAKDAGPPEPPGEIVFEQGFDVDGNPVDPRDPKAVMFEVHTRDAETGEVTRTYGRA